MPPSLCIITPTISRPTLARTLKSAALQPGDEWLVVGDGPQPEAERIVAALHLPGVRYLEGPESHNWGNEQRDFAMPLATADYIGFLDDDDVFTPGALETIRRQLAGMPTMFCMTHNGGIIWREQVVAPGNTGTAMFYVPNVPGRYGRWGVKRANACDYIFMTETMRHWPTLVWLGDVIVESRPE